MPPGFPLFRLPDNVVLSVFRSMGVAQQILLSVVSMQAKKIVCSLNLHPDCESISLYTFESWELHLVFQLYPFVMSVTFEKFEKDAEREIVEIERPERVEFYFARIDGNRFESEKYQWENTTFEVRDYIDHFMEILHHDRIDILSVTRNIPLESIQQLVNGLEIRKLIIYERNSEDDMMNYLNAIKPSRSLNFERSPSFVWNHTRMSQFFIQNLDQINIGKASSLTLDDLLLMNMSEIKINETRMTGKDFNRFLKHWIAGSNPRLRYLWIGCHLTDDFEEEQYERDLLQGIDHRKMADGEERTYVGPIHMDAYEEHTETISGGFYIRRKDGTEAIVHIEELWFTFILQ